MAYSFLLLAAPVAVLGLPGSFGRYLTRYRQQGQLRMFLRRTASWTFGLAGVAVGAIVVWRSAFATLVFGDPTQNQLMLMIAVCLAAVILHHFLEAVFAGLRLFRVVSTMHFCQSMGFAAIALTLLATWRVSAISVVIGYGAACLVSSIGVLIWASFNSTLEADDSDSVRHSEFWPPLMQFAIWVWVSNLLCNLFSIVDRYMIIHFGGFENSVALEQVGNYHTATIVPLLLVSVANLLVGAMTPHLSHDWEAGKKEAVADRLNFTLKLTAVGMTFIGVGVLLFCPWLFEVAFHNKYAQGLEALPWTLCACVWFSLLLLAQTYVWCAERSRLATPPLAVGLVGNILLNLMLLPLWGLIGAVVATAVSTLLALVVQLIINRNTGMKLQVSTIVACTAPLCLAGGFSVAIAGLLVMLAVTPRLLTAGERQEVESMLHKLKQKLLPNRLQLETKA